VHLRSSAAVNPEEPPSASQVALSSDLTPEALQAALRGRPVRSYAALVSTGSAAHGWARDGAPDGAVVIAEHQISPRGHAGRPLNDMPGEGVGLSLVMRPSLPAAREGWLYTLVLTGLADVLGEGSTLKWPDEVRVGGSVAAAVGISTQLEEAGHEIRWAIVDVLLASAARPRGRRIAAVLEAIDARAADAPEAVLRDYARVCETLGRQVRARLRAGTGPSVEGRALEALEDGALVLEMSGGLKAPVRPQDVRRLEAL